MGMMARNAFSFVAVFIGKCCEKCNHKGKTLLRRIGEFLFFVNCVKTAEN